MRAVEIGAVVAQAQSEGFWVVMLTLTLRHDRGQRLPMLWDAVARCWHSAAHGSGWTRDVERFGIEGYVRAMEVTWSERNGWHPHVHALIVCRAGADVEEMGRSMWERWALAVDRVGLEAPLIQASEWHKVTGAGADTALGQYLSKGIEGAGSIGRELVASSGKVARSRYSTITPWAVLAEFLENGETRMKNVWHEWELGSKGRRQLGWSKGLRDRFGLGRERSDEDVAAEELGSVEDTVCYISAAGWASLVKRPHLIPEVMETLEAGGWPALESWLIRHGVEYVPVNVGTCSCVA